MCAFMRIIACQMHMDDLEGHFSRPDWYGTGAGTACRTLTTHLYNSAGTNAVMEL